MAAERLADLLADPPESVVQRQDLCRQVSHDLGGDVLAGLRGVLGLGSFQRGSGDGVSAAHWSIVPAKVEGLRSKAKRLGERGWTCRCGRGCSPRSRRRPAEGNRAASG